MTRELLVAAYGFWFPDLRLNPGPLHWEHRVFNHWTTKEVFPDLLMKWFESWPLKMPSGIQFSSVAQLCPTLCDPMNPVHHHLPEFTQTHVHRVSDAIQPSHPLVFPSLPAPNPSQHQSLFQ